MIPLGTEIPHDALVVRRDRTLEVFDGCSLLSVCRNAGSDPFLVKWMDRDRTGGVERWLVFRVSELELIQFEFLKKSLRDLVLGARDGFAFVRDTHGSAVVRTAIIHISEIPGAYLPGPNSLHDQDLNPSFDTPTNEQSFLIDGLWEPEDFAELDRKYKQAYSFMGAFGVNGSGDPDYLAGRLTFEPLAAGWQYKPAFDAMAASLPTEHRARMSTVQYNSPGLLRFDVDGPIAASLREAYAALSADPERGKLFEAAHRPILALSRVYTEVRRAHQAEIAQMDEAQRLAHMQALYGPGDDEPIGIPDSTDPSIPRQERIALIAAQPSAGYVLLIPPAWKPAEEAFEREATEHLERLASSLRVVDFRALLALTGSVYVAGQLLLSFIRRMKSLAKFARKGSAELVGLPSEDVDGNILALAEDTDVPEDEDE